MAVRLRSLPASLAEGETLSGICASDAKVLCSIGPRGILLFKRSSNGASSERFAAPLRSGRAAVCAAALCGPLLLCLGDDNVLLAMDVARLARQAAASRLSPRPLCAPQRADDAVVDQATRWAVALEGVAEGARAVSMSALDQERWREKDDLRVLVVFADGGVRLFDGRSGAALRRCAAGQGLKVSSASAVWRGADAGADVLLCTGPRRFRALRGALRDGGAGECEGEALSVEGGDACCLSGGRSGAVLTARSSGRLEGLPSPEGEDADADAAAVRGEPIALRTAPRESIVAASVARDTLCALGRLPGGGLRLHVAHVGRPTLFGAFAAHLDAKGDVLHFQLHAQSLSERLSVALCASDAAAFVDVLPKAQGPPQGPPARAPDGGGGAAQSASSHFLLRALRSLDRGSAEGAARCFAEGGELAAAAACRLSQCAGDAARVRECVWGAMGAVAPQSDAHLLDGVALFSFYVALRDPGDGPSDPLLQEVVAKGLRALEERVGARGGARGAAEDAEDAENAAAEAKAPRQSARSTATRALAAARALGMVAVEHRRGGAGAGPAEGAAEAEAERRCAAPKDFAGAFVRAVWLSSGARRGPREAFALGRTFAAAVLGRGQALAALDDAAPPALRRRLDAFMAVDAAHAKDGTS